MTLTQKEADFLIAELAYPRHFASDNELRLSILLKAVMARTPQAQKARDSKETLVEACETLLELARMLADTESDETTDRFNETLAAIEGHMGPGADV